MDRVSSCRAVLGGLLVMALSSPAFAATMPVACPKEPVRVVRSAGGVVDYRGSVPGIPDLCRMVRADGPADYYFGLWRSDWPGAGLAYPAMRAVLAAGPGARSSFVTRMMPGMQWNDIFINDGYETLVVNGRRYTTLKLAHEREGIEGNTYHSVITGWRDVQTGMTLKVVERQISGQSYGPETTWQAERVERLR